MKIPEEKDFLPIVESCQGCEKATDSLILKDEQRCVAYLNPAIHWRNGNSCPLATHVDGQEAEQMVGKVRVGQQKQKKVKR
jgi:hypothetical protein